MVLVDADGEEAYPLPGYTYMILRMDAFDSCDKAVQLYRYIDWFTTHPDAQRECEKLFMAPVRCSQIASSYKILNNQLRFIAFHTLYAMNIHSK